MVYTASIQRILVERLPAGHQESSQSESSFAQAELLSLLRRLTSFHRHSKPRSFIHYNLSRAEHVWTRLPRLKVSLLLFSEARLAALTSHHLNRAFDPFLGVITGVWACVRSISSPCAPLTIPNRPQLRPLRTTPATP